MPASEQLKKIYADAFSSGFYIKEVPAEEGFVAFCGNVKKMSKAGFDTKEKRENMGLFNRNIYMTAGGGESREEAVENAFELCKNSESWIPAQ